VHTVLLVASLLVAMLVWLSRRFIVIGAPSTSTLVALWMALIAAIVLLWNRAIGPLELGLMLGLYVTTCLGVTLGYVQ